MEPDTGSAVVLVTARQNRRRWIVAGLIASLAIGGTIAVALLLGARQLPEAFTYVPADSVAVIEVRPDLPGDQRQHLGNLLAHLPGFADQSTLSAKLDEALSRLVSRVSNGSVDYATRVKPLLGGPIVASTGPGAIAATDSGTSAKQGLFVATTDGSASCASVFGTASALESHRSVQIDAVASSLACAVDGQVLLVGDAASIRAAIDAHADHHGIDTNARFVAARGRLVGDQIGSLFLDGKALARVAGSLVPAIPVDSTALAAIPDWVVAGVRVTDDAIQIDVQAAPVAGTALASDIPTAAPPARSRMADLLPADALGFVEVHGFGVDVQRGLAMLKTDPKQSGLITQLEQALTAVGGVQNVAGWIQDVGVAVVPHGDTLAGVVMLTGTDAASVSSRLTQLHNLLVLASTGTDITVHDVDHGGITISTVDLGDPRTLLSTLGIKSGVGGAPGLGSGPVASSRLVISLAARGDVMLLGIGDGVIERILDTASGSSLGSTATYQHVVGLAGSPNHVEAYVALDGLVTWFDSHLPATMDATSWTKDVKPYLDHLAGLMGTTAATDTGGRSRLVITIK